MNETTHTSTALDELFESVLPTLNLPAFLAYLKEHHLDQTQVLNQVWTDSEGHAWSLLSRWGYGSFHNEQNYPHGDVLHFLLDNMTVARVGGETQPGEKDLVWAWFGSLRAAGNFKNENMERLHLAFHTHHPTLGWGSVGDGGWLSEGLALLVATVRKNPSDSAQHALEVFNMTQEWIGANLLAENSHLYSRRLWEFDARSQMDAWMPRLQPLTHNRDPQSNMERGPVELAHLPDANAYRITSETPRPIELGVRFSEVFQNMVRHSKNIQEALGMEFRFNQLVLKPHDVERLDTALSDEAWQTWANLHLGHLLRPCEGADDVWHSDLATLDYLFTKPVDLWASKEKQALMVEFLMQTGNKGVDEHTPPRLRAWAREQRLDGVLTPNHEPGPPTSRKTPRF